MKIPAHLLSPVASNSKAAQNAAPRSVADFLSKQSDTPKDFFSAMKSLQNLVKPQTANEQKMIIGRDAPAVQNNSMATKFAELKLAEPGVESMKQEPRDPDGSNDFLQSNEEQIAPSQRATHIGKAVSLERSFVLNEMPSVEGTSERTADVDGFPALPKDAGAKEGQLTTLNSSSIDQVGGHFPTGVETLANPRAKISADTASVMNGEAELQQGREGKFAPAAKAVVDNGATISNSKPMSENNVSIAQGSPSLGAVEKSQRQGEITRQIADREISARTISANTTSEPAILAIKSEAKLDASLTSQFHPADALPTVKQSSGNGASSQIGNVTAAEFNLTQSQSVQSASMVSAKEITAQVTRHLNSELLNMDLRTQIVSERAASNGLNTSTLTLQLHPIGLGRVQAEIRKEGELVRIKLTVEAKGTFDILKNDIDALKTAMRALGTAEGDVMLTQGNINRLPNDTANTGQNFFANDRDSQSELRERQDRDSGDQHEAQSGADHTGQQASASVAAKPFADNTVTI